MKKSKQMIFKIFQIVNFTSISILFFGCMVLAQMSKDPFWSEVVKSTKDYLLLKQVTAGTPNRNILVVIRFAEKKENIILSEDVNQVAVSSDGNKIAYTECKENGLWIYDFVENKTLRISDKLCYSLSFSDDSTRLSYLSVEGDKINLYLTTTDGKQKDIIHTMSAKEYR